MEKWIEIFKMKWIYRDIYHGNSPPNINIDIITSL